MKKRFPFLKKEGLILVIILSIGLIVRLYKINSPLADHYSWRQVDTASVAKNFVERGFDLLHPRYHDLSNIQSGKENPQGWRMVEFPLYNAIFGLLYKLNPSLSLEVYGRLTSTVFTLISIAILYYLLLKEYSLTAAAIGGISYALLPFVVFFTRVVLPEPTAISFIMISIFFTYLYSREKKKIKTAILYLFSLLFFTLAILVKPTTVFFALPIVYLFFKKHHVFALAKLRFWAYFIFSLTPFLIWRIYILNYPEGIPAFNWLTTKINTPQGLQPIFFKPAFFRWIFFERINNLILGGYLTFFLVYGIIKNKNGLFVSMLLSSLIYLLTFQGGNVQHEYYQTLIFPTIAAFLGIGAERLGKELKNKTVALLLFSIIFLFSLYFSFYKVREFYRIPPDLINYARIIKTFTKPDDLIITDTMGDTTLLYLSERKGAPAPYKDLDELKNQGYKYFITYNKETAKKILKEKPYKPIFKSETLTIIELK